MCSEDHFKHFEENIQNNIWITSRTRMISERRAIRWQNISFLSVPYYSLFSIIISIFSDYYRQFYVFIDSFIIASSIVVLVFSLVASGFNFKDYADLYRACYLELQNLSSEKLSNAEMRSKYTEILGSFPNHSVYDYYEFLVLSKFIEGKEIENGKEGIKVSRYMIAIVILRKIILSLVISFLFCVPIIFLMYPILR